MNKTAVIYSRVSSLGERQSNERQIEDLKILTKQKNHTIEKSTKRKYQEQRKMQKDQFSQSAWNTAFPIM